jgi:hypothetical protein
MYRRRRTTNMMTALLTLTALALGLGSGNSAKAGHIPELSSILLLGAVLLGLTKLAAKMRRKAFPLSATSRLRSFERSAGMYPIAAGREKVESLVERRFCSQGEGSV